MLQGRLIQLRPVREADLDAMYAAHANISDRGPHFPLGVLSEPAFRREFCENGCWQQDEGTLLIVTSEHGEMVGHIEFLRGRAWAPCSPDSAPRLRSRRAPLRGQAQRPGRR